MGVLTNHLSNLERGQSSGDGHGRITSVLLYMVKQLEIIRLVYFKNIKYAMIYREFC